MEWCIHTTIATLASLDRNNLSDWVSNGNEKGFGLKDYRGIVLAHHYDRHLFSQDAQESHSEERVAP